MRFVLMTLLCTMLGVATVTAEEIVGAAVVVDGDTIELEGRQLRLFGIDAPEAAQTLPLASGGQDFFGRGAALVLRSMLKEGEIRCDVAGKHDKRGAMLATCFSGKTDLAAAMIERGMAWITPEYSSPYAAIEAEAREKRRGFWRDELERPWLYRRRMQLLAESAAPKGCVFKATADQNGRRIYFSPWSPWYRKFQVDLVRGDKWLCSEAEAIAAGWKSPLFLMDSIVGGVYYPQG